MRDAHAGSERMQREATRATWVASAMARLEVARKAPLRRGGLDVDIKKLEHRRTRPGNLYERSEVLETRESGKTLVCYRMDALTLQLFVLDHHCIHQHAATAPLGRTDHRGSSGAWPQRVRLGRSVRGLQRVPETETTNRARNPDR